MSRTNAVEVSIQAVSPLFGTGAAAAEASAGASPPKTPDHTLTVRIVFGCIGGFLRLEIRGRSPGISGGSHREHAPHAHRGARKLDPARNPGAVSVPLGMPMHFRDLRATCRARCTVLELVWKTAPQYGAWENAWTRCALTRSHAA